MKIAVPLDHDLVLYKQNPYTAPKFAIYIIEQMHTDVSFRINAIVANPKYALLHENFSKSQIESNCDEDIQNCFHHMCEHYSLLEVISGCNYLLADRYCKNTSHALKNGGVEVFKIPSIIQTTEKAIKNFLISTNQVKKISNIHNLS